MTFLTQRAQKTVWLFLTRSHDVDGWFTFRARRAPMWLFGLKVPNLPRPEIFKLNLFFMSEFFCHQAKSARRTNSVRYRCSRVCTHFSIVSRSDCCFFLNRTYVWHQPMDTGSLCVSISQCSLSFLNKNIFSQILSRFNSKSQKFMFFFTRFDRAFQQERFRWAGFGIVDACKTHLL